MSEITNPGDIAEILANTDPDAQRLSDLVSEILDILQRRSWPGVIGILTEPTPKVVGFVGGTSFNPKDMLVHVLLHSSDFGSAVAAAMVEIHTANTEEG